MAQALAIRSASGHSTAQEIRGLRRSSTKAASAATIIATTIDPVRVSAWTALSASVMVTTNVPASTANLR